MKAESEPGPPLVSSASGRQMSLCHLLDTHPPVFIHCWVHPRGSWLVHKVYNLGKEKDCTRAQKLHFCDRFFFFQHYFWPKKLGCSRKFCVSHFSGKLGYSCWGITVQGNCVKKTLRCYIITGLLLNDFFIVWFKYFCVLDLLQTQKGAICSNTVTSGLINTGSLQTCEKCIVLSIAQHAMQSNNTNMY